MDKFDSIIIGFGKGGKTLAVELANHGEQVAVIEKSEQMYGGTCINIGCIPTKYLIHQGSQEKAETREERKKKYKEIIQHKKVFIAKLRQKNYEKLVSHPNIQVIQGNAKFLSNHEIQYETAKGKYTIEGEKIFINTGAKTVIPLIPGLEKIDHQYTSTTIMEEEELPEKLIIVGGGYIGLEYANMYANFGSQVTLLEANNDIMLKEEPEIRELVKENFWQKGIKIELNAKIELIEEKEKQVTVHLSDKKIHAYAILIAVGRKANTEDLQLSKAGVQTNERGEIIVDQYLHTTTPNIWAIGDVKGGLQFTYISLDDYRIIQEELWGNKKYGLTDRKLVPYSVFLDPPLARIGLTEEQARKQSDVKVAMMKVEESPKAKLLGKTEGMLKAVVDAKTNQILGVTIYGELSYEIINTVRMAMLAGFDYTVLRDSIYTHPTMTEILNDLFARI